MNLEDIMLSEISDTQKNKCVMIPPILVPMVVKIQTEGRMQAARDWERWDEEFMFKADCFSLATHSNVLAWRIPGMGEPGGLLSMGSHRVGHN